MDASLEGMAENRATRLPAVRQGVSQTGQARPWRRDPDAWSRMPWAVVSVPVWRFESQMAKVLEKFRFKDGISEMA